MKDLRELPKVRDSCSYVYLEHCKIEQDGKSICYYDKVGKVPVPCATILMLMLGPGTSITHSAIKALAENGCLVVWTGDEGVRFYAQGMGETRNSANLLKQAKLCSIPQLRISIVRKLYEMRFDEVLDKNLTLQQIRGMEGIRVREAYRKGSQDNGIEWKGRNYKFSSWSESDKVNRALSTANACLYGLCHSAIVSLGYSPGLGFIHTGKQLSFVYDIADLYKTEITIPIAFQTAAADVDNLEREVRIKCRDFFKDTRILIKIVDDLDKIMSYYNNEELKEFNYDRLLEEGKGGEPCKIWSGDYIQGGINYGDMSNKEGDKDSSNDS